MNVYSVSNLLFFIQTLSETLDDFNDLVAHCPEPDTDENDFLCRHLNAVSEFLHSELISACHMLAKEDDVFDD